jgi:hypothetical protein
LRLNSYQIDKLSGLATIAGQVRPEFPENVDDHCLEVGRRVPQEGNDETVTLPPDGGRVAIEKESFNELGQKIGVNMTANLQRIFFRNKRVGRIEFNLTSFVPEYH